VKEVTGRESTNAELERWGELAELLITELKIAAGRTGSVSSVPAFLTEHLRRRLWKKDRRQVEEEEKSSAQSSQLKGDASKCPDCFGTGMWYPEGFERGVARCEHKQLVADE
jgi:ATP phosphoribosyltransferase regulatory subunit HisZ